MPTNNNDRLLVNDGSKTETITFAQFKDGTVLNDSDKFLINDGQQLRPSHGRSSRAKLVLVVLLIRQQSSSQLMALVQVT